MKWLLTYIFTLLLLPAMTQDSCYYALRAEGLRYLQQNDYKLSINRFIAARFCLDMPEEDDLFELIRQAQEAWVAELEAAREEAYRAVSEALVAKGMSEKARKEAEKAREEADAALEVAREHKRLEEQQAVLAEANRLALLAENEIKSGNYPDALYLAFRAMQLTSPKAPPAIKLAFGRAVYHNRTTEPARQKEGEAAFFLALSKSPRVAVIYSNGLMLLPLDSSAEASAPNLDKRFARGPIIALALSENERFLLACAAGGDALLWNLDNNKGIVMKGHREDVLGGAFAPGEGQVLTWSQDNTARLWDTTGSLLAVLSGHEGNIYQGCFAPKGRRGILTRSADRTARLWDMEGNPAAPPLQHNGYVYSAVFSPDGTSVLTASSDSTARLWNREGELLTNFKGHTQAVKEAIFSPKGDQVLTRSLDGSLKLWSTEGQELASFRHANGQPLGASFNQAGDEIISFTQAGEVLAWNTQGELLRKTDKHTAPVMAVRRGAEEQLLLSTSRDGTAKLWSAEGHLLMSISIQKPAEAPAQFSADGKKAIAISGEGKIIQCPVPKVAFEEMESDFPFSPEEVSRLNMEYNISNYLERKFKEKEKEEEPENGHSGSLPPEVLNQ